MKGKKALPTLVASSLAAVMNEDEFRETDLLVELRKFPDGLSLLKIHDTEKAAAKARAIRSANTPPWFKIGRKVLYNQRGVLEWLSRCRVNPTKTEEA
jgi:hypothetical protein